MPTWDDKARSYIRDNYERLSDGEMGKMLGKAAASIKAMRLRLGIKRAEQFARDEKSRSYIRDNYERLSDGEMAKTLRKNKASVVAMRLALGIKRAEQAARLVLIDGKGICRRCGKEKFLRELKKRGSNFRPYCQSCFNIRSVGWVKSMRVKVFDHYGWECQCCGDKHPECMTLDHIHNDGRKHRFPGGGKKTGKALYALVIKNGFPNTFQALCHNCNFGKAVYGICPHKRLLKSVVN